jgi:hypothetical protein
MITRDQMIQQVLDVCPSFNKTWNEFLSEWEGKSGELPIFLALAELARHLIHLLESNDTETLKKVFNVVEQWNLNGDDYVQNAATVGLLEDLQNTNLHEKTTPEQFKQFLGIDSKMWWRKVERFWEFGAIITNDRLYYLRITDNVLLPDISHLKPFKTVIVIEKSVSNEYRHHVCKWLVKSGCLYVMALGLDCESWHDTIDDANLEYFNYGDIPKESFVMTTWHDNEPIADVFNFAKNIIPTLQNMLILHISETDRETQYIDLIMGK